MATLRGALLTLAMAWLLGCAHEIRLVNLSDGATIEGTSKLWDQSVTLTMPSGEIVEGHYVSLSSAKIGPDSLFYRANVGQMLGGHVSGRFHGYALLTGQNGTIIEMVFASEWTGHGFGVARAGSGEEYRVTF